MIHTLVNTDRFTVDTNNMVSKIINKCILCKKFKRSLPRNEVTLPTVTESNNIKTWDFKEKHNGKHILWMIDSYS